MATLNEIAYDLLSIVRPQLSDDTDISLDQIKFWVNNQRALWIKREMDRNRAIDDDIQQVICAELEVADASDCCDVQTGCSILRTKEEIPNPIELHNKPAITRVGNVNKLSRPFSFVDYSRVPYVGNGKFNKDNIFTFLHNSRIYVISNSPFIAPMQNIVIRGVFEDPREVANFTDCDNGKPCYSDDQEYPIKSWMLPQMKDMVLKNNLLITAQAEQQSADESNDGKSNPSNKI
jgi:hypothetical protein